MNSMITRVLGKFNNLMLNNSIVVILKIHFLLELTMKNKLVLILGILTVTFMISTIVLHMTDPEESNSKSNCDEKGTTTTTEGSQ